MIERGTPNRIYGLDILRASAILFVMQSHSLRYIVPHTDVHYYWLFILDGVDLFFVLSGFLIGSILIRTINDNGFSRNELFHFWSRRWFRTLPNYFLVLIILLGGYFYAFGALPAKAAHFFFFAQNFDDPHPRFFPEAWSLAVEEWFYVLIPLGLFFLVRHWPENKKRTVLAWILCILIIATSIRLFKVSTYDYFSDNTWDSHIRKLVLTRMDSIMYGVLGAWLIYYHSATLEKRKNSLFVAGLLVLFGSRYIGSFNAEYYRYFYISMQSIGTLLLLPKFNSIISGRGTVFKAISFISAISYSMYLLNYTIVSNIVVPGILRLAGMDYTKNSLHSIVAYALFWSLTIGMSFLLYRFYEKPMMNLRNRFNFRKIKPVLHEDIS